MRILLGVNLGKEGSFKLLIIAETYFLFNLAPKIGYLLWEIDCYHSDVAGITLNYIDFKCLFKRCF